MFIKDAIKVLVIVIVAFAFASVATAYAATNSVSASAAGDGEGTISGYSVTLVHYTLAADPTNIASVAFHIAPTTVGAAPTSAYVKIGAVVSSACVLDAQFDDATCAITAPVSTAILLTVIATQ